MGRKRGTNVGPFSCEACPDRRYTTLRISDFTRHLMSRHQVKRVDEHAKIFTSQSLVDHPEAFRAASRAEINSSNRTKRKKESREAAGGTAAEADPASGRDSSTNTTPSSSARDGASPKRVRMENSSAARQIKDCSIRVLRVRPPPSSTVNRAASPVPRSRSEGRVAETTRRQ